MWGAMLQAIPNGLAGIRRKVTLLFRHKGGSQGNYTSNVSFAKAVADITTSPKQH